MAAFASMRDNSIYVYICKMMKDDHKFTDNPLGLSIDLKPGIVYFFTPEQGELPDRWKHYVDHLRMAMYRRGIEVREILTPRRDLTWYTVARLYNIGNLGENAYAWICGGYGPTVAGASLESLAERLVWTDNVQRGSVDVTDSYHLDEYFDAHDVKGCVSCIEDEADYDDDGICDEAMAEAPCIYTSSVDDIAETYALPPQPSLTPEEDQFLEHLDEERRQILNRIGMLINEYVRQYHEMPPIEMFSENLYGKFILPQQATQYSPVVVNGNLDIVLPDYNEMMLRLTPLPKIIYILFLNHPEGIILKDIGDYRSELAELYLLVKPGSDAALAHMSIDDLCIPGSESLNQKISMIKRAIKIQLPTPSLLDHYSITGRRGQPYVLPASSNCRLPSILKTQ